MLIDNEKTISDYTESEFIAPLSNFFENKHGLNARYFGKFIDDLQLHVVKVTQHPLGNGLILMLQMRLNVHSWEYLRK